MARVVAERAEILPILAEVFREHGYEGASLSLIERATGLGKGSLYHFFPGGKAEMAACVLADIEGWFETNIFQPLRDPANPAAQVEAMLTAVEAYFRSGRRVCLMGALALTDARDRFADAVRGYFVRWIEALAEALARSGVEDATRLAEESVAAIQGGIVLARALDDAGAFTRTLAALRLRLAGRRQPQ